MGNTDDTREIELPARYPRTLEIIFFDDMSELDYVLGLLSSTGRTLAELPADTTDADWKKCAADPLLSLAKCLRKAYIEYERFWQPDGWSIEKDQSLAMDLNDAHEMWWRVRELEPARYGKYYDPAGASCAKSLYFVLALIEYPGERDWVEYCIESIRYELTRYHAAALEIVLQRDQVYKTKLKAELASQAANIQTGQKIRNAAASRVAEQKRKAEAEAKYLRKRVEELHRGNLSKTGAVKKTADEFGCKPDKVWRALRMTENSTITPGD